MAGPYAIRKFYQPPVGLDLRSSMMERSPNMAASMKNVDYIYTDDGDAITQRSGYQGILDLGESSGKMYGVTGSASDETIFTLKHTRVESSTGLTTVEHLAIGEELFVIEDETITLTESLAGTVTVSVLAVSGVWRMQISENGTVVTNGDISLDGISIKDLADDINANVTSVTMIYGTPDSGSQRIAHVAGAQGPVNTITVDDGAGGNHNLEVGDMVFFTDTGATDHYREITEVTGTTLSFDGSAVTVADNAEIRLRLGEQAATNIASVIDEAVSTSQTFDCWNEKSVYSSSIGSFYFNVYQDRNNDEFRLPSFVNTKNVTYITFPLQGVDNQTFAKYDGQNIFRAGVPQAADFTSVAGAGSGSGLAAGTYQYFATWIQEDHQGNIVEGLPNTITSVTLAGAEDVTVQFSAAGIGSSDGYLMNGKDARASSTQAGVTTIGVDNGSGGDHNISVGDKVYFYDGVAAAHTERTVTSATYPGTGGTITISGAAVNVTNNDRITVNSRVALYRTKVGGTTDFFLVDEYPWSGGTVTDSTADASLGAQYLTPVANTEHGEPPANPGFLTLHQGALVIGGAADDPDALYYSVPGSPEYFPPSLKTNVLGGANELITGVGSDENFLMVFFNNSSHIISGQLLEPIAAVPAFRIDVLSGGIGCTSHNTIQNVEGTLFFLSEKGPMRTIGGGRPEPVLDTITPVFTNNDSLSATTKLQFIRATSVYDQKDRKYMLYIPAEDASVNGGNSSSRMFVYDVNRNGWREWTNINMAGGGVVIGRDDIRFLEWPSSGDGILHKFLSIGTKHDLTDNAASGVDWEVIPGWDSLGEPSAFAVYLRNRVYAPMAESPDFTLTVVTEVDWKSTAHTTGSIVFSGTDLPRPLKLKPTKARAMRYKFTHNTLYEQVLISGWETEATLPYRPALKE